MKPIPVHTPHRPHDTRKLFGSLVVAAIMLALVIWATH